MDLDKTGLKGKAAECFLPGPTLTQLVQELPAMQEAPGLMPGWEILLEEGHGSPTPEIFTCWRFHVDRSLGGLQS